MRAQVLEESLFQADLPSRNLGAPGGMEATKQLTEGPCSHTH